MKHALGSVPPETGPFRLHLDGQHSKTLYHVPPGEAVFFFLRDPVTRFVSAFYSRQRQGRPLADHPWTEAEIRAFDRFTTANALAEAISAGESEVRAEAEDAMRGIGHVNTHFAKWAGRPQYFLSRRKDVLFIGRQETLTADFERLKSLLSLPDGLALPTDDVAAHRNPQTVDRRLSETGEANIRRWYRADFAFIALCERRGLLHSDA